MLNLAVCNVANDGKQIFIWHRTGKTLNLFKDNTFFPYFFQESPTGIFHTIDGKRVNKLFCSRPSDVSKRRDENSYEADVLYYRRYVIDKIGAFLPCELKYSFIDIEVQCPELPSILNPIYPIVSISCSNSYTSEIKTFFLKDYQYPLINELIERTEQRLLTDFIYWIKEEKFDFLAGWNFIDFDYQYLRARYARLFNEELADKLSPINSNRIIGKKDEEDPLKIPTGLGIVDYLAWFKKVYKGRHSYALDYIAQEELKETAYEKVDFNVLSDKVKEKNINDVRRMVDIEKKLKIINYFDELRRMSKSDWQDLDWNSKMLDMMLLTEAKQKGIVLPSKKYGIETDETFEGAYRRCDTGLYKNLWKLDLSSAYPMAIINFCLDVQNIKENEGIDINGTKFYQNTNALLPSLARKLIDKKDYLKKQLKALDPETEEAKDLQVKYDAVKGVVNSLFGVCGLKVFRLFDMRVAGAITFLVRDLLHYIETELEKQNIKVIYIDTDSVFVDSKENPKDMLNQLIAQWAKEKYNKDNVGIEFDLEGKINKILIVALCHYIAEVETKKGIKKEIKGVEVKRSDSSKYMKYFQETLIDKIMNDESREAIEAFIASEKEAIKQRPLLDIGFPCKMSGKTDYKSLPIGLRALEYTKEIIPNFNKVPGDSFWYVPIESFGTSIRKSSRKKKGIVELQQSETEIAKNVLCFDENFQEHIIKIDWKRVIEKSIDAKVTKIFEALKWENNEIKPKRSRKKAGIQS
jgi:DNA polymerase elongation subunit (family B)